MSCQAPYQLRVGRRQTTGCDGTFQIPNRKWPHPSEQRIADHLRAIQHLLPAEIRRGRLEHCAYSEGVNQIVDWQSQSASGWRVRYWFNQPDRLCRIKDGGTRQFRYGKNCLRNQCEVPSVFRLPQVPSYAAASLVC
ncbi:hypothetical protein CA601_43995 [Paraburkholderia hospita]|nr:hypothetical protein CA601_43995 [Paraburkholderia hospita]